jgi:hypothetical protein
MAAQKPHCNVSLEKDPLVRQCAKHPSVETRLTCSHCEIPICPKCMIICEVGMKCKQCTTKTVSHVVKAEWRDWLFSGLTSVAVGFVFGLIVSQLIFGFGYYLLLLSFFGGKWAGGLIHRCARFKMARSVMHVMTAGCSLGLLLSLSPLLLPAIAAISYGQQSLTSGQYYPMLMEIGASVAFIFGLRSNFHHFRQF